MTPIHDPIIPVRFFVTENGHEPVREWLKELGRPDSQIVGEDIRTIQRGFPVGMPVCRALRDGLYEIRSDLTHNRISRVLFCFSGNQIVLLHGFIKKTRKTPDADLRKARDRQRQI